MDLPNQAPGGARKLAIERFADDAFTYMRFSGAIDETFDGKKLAASVKTPTLVLHLAEVHRMSSFGIREWGNFIDGLARSVDKLVLIECSPKVMDQLNMVANFIGAGRVFSFYAPYRCDYCDSDDRVLFQVDRDWDLIKGRKPPELPCSTCGELEHFDEDPVTYFSYMADQGPFELDDEIRVLLASASKLDSAVAEVGQRLRVDKVVEGRFTYIKLGGDMDATFPRVKLAEGLEGVVILDLSEMGRLDPAGAAQWRTFLQMITPVAEAIYILGMPPLFLEKLGSVADMGPRTQLLSFAMLYSCTRCGVTAPYVVDVEAHHGILRFGTAPEMACRDCQAPAQCTAGRELMQQLSALPRPQVPASVRSFIDSVGKRKAGGRMQTRAGTSRAGGGRGLSWLVAVLVVLVLGAGGALGYLYLQGQKGGGATLSRYGVGDKLGASADARPSWIVSDTPLAAECDVDMKMFKMDCTGVSTFAGSEDDAVEQATDAALDAMVREIGLLIDEPAWSTTVGTAYRRVRQAKVARFFDEGLRAPGSMQHQRAEEALLDSREAVVRALRRTADDIVDTGAPGEQYKERYAAADGPGERHLVFARVQLTAAQVRKLLEVYARPLDVLGATVMTAFPGLAWRYPDLEAGAVIIALGRGYLRGAGAAEGQIVTAVQGRMIKDADALARIAEEILVELERDGGTLRFTVESGDGEPTELSVEVAGLEIEDED